MQEPKETTSTVPAYGEQDPSAKIRVWPAGDSGGSIGAITSPAAMMGWLNRCRKDHRWRSRGRLLGATIKRGYFAVST